MPKQMKRSLPKIYLIVGFVFSALFVLLAKPERALAAFCPAAGNDVTIAADCDWVSGTTYTYTGLLTINSGVTVTVVYDAGTPSQAIVNSDSMLIIGDINLNAQGFPVGEGTGAGTDQGGGGYGGTGGGTGGGITYGSATDPADLGSGGSSTAGGGALKLVAGIITINGTISANGENSAILGAGSGGSIWVQSSGTLSGSGSVTANGGTSPTGGGGGGRISMSTEVYSFSGTMSATGAGVGGQVGTIRLFMTPPFVDSLTPSSIVAGTDSLLVRIEGNNFESGAIARFSGVDKTTAYISPTLIRVTLGASDMSTAGVYEITVHNPISNTTSNAADFTVNNPVPVLSGITPSSKYLEDTDLTIQLLGSSFLTASQVYLDAVARSFTYVGPTQLIMNLLTSDLTVAGSHLISVVNPIPGGGTSTNATFTVLVRPSPPGGGASPISYDYTTGNVPKSPSAGFGKSLDSASIRWYFGSKPGNNIIGFHLVNADNGLVLATSTDLAATYIDEAGLNASSTYCQRAIRAYSQTASSIIDATSMFPCATTLPMAVATSSEFTNNPVRIISIDVEALNLGWSPTSSALGRGKQYGFYIPALQQWVVPATSNSATTAPTSGVYTLGQTAFYQSIDQWGSDFKVTGLESETTYNFMIVRSGFGVWEFLAKTLKGVLTFEAEMEMIQEEIMPNPTASTTLSVLSGAAQRSWPSLAPAAFMGAVALAVHKHIKRRKKSAKSSKPAKKQADKTKKKSSVPKRKSNRSKLVAVMFMLGSLGASLTLIFGASAIPAHAAGVETLTYQLKFTNTGTKTAKNVLVTDPIPQGTLYYPGSLQVDGVSQTDAKDADYAWYSGSPAQANFLWVTVAPGQSHVMKFSVYLQQGVQYEQVSNSASLQPENADPGTLPLVFHEQSVCGNSKIEIVRDQNGDPVLSGGHAIWESCDDGANNGLGYGWCKSDCSAVALPPTNLCGNGKIDEWTNLKTNQTYKETCDQGSLNGQPGKCNLTCNGTVPVVVPKPPKKEEEKKPEVKPVTGGVVTSTEVTPTSTVPVVVTTTTETTTTIPAPVVETVPPTSSGTVTAAGSIGEALSNATRQAADALAAPEVQAAAIPALGVITAVNIVSGAGWIPLLNYLYYIFTQPIMLLGRRKKQKYGVVYNSLSKLPLDLTAVRIKDNAGRIVQTKITDRQGRYTFLIPKGQYALDISKPGYVFPTSLLAGKVQDVDYLDLLTTNKLNFAAAAVVSNNIPLDPKEDKRPPSEIKRKVFLRRVQGGAAILTTLLSIGAFALVPNYQYLGLAAFQIVTYFVFRRLAHRKSPSSFGVIKDAKTGQTIKNAVVRILDAQFNRILETQIADANGRYAFLVGKGKFYVTVTKEGYESLRGEVIDCSNAKGSMVIDKELKLKKL
ncbi:MAG: hypothetical protein WC750_02420 [Patescibacteria group bacterium]|jgi:uncharacterized repeat protein (TIGR01451 family)